MGINNNPIGNLLFGTRWSHLCYDVCSTYRSVYFLVYCILSCSCIFSEYRGFFPGKKRMEH